MPHGFRFTWHRPGEDKPVRVLEGRSTSLESGGHRGSRIELLAIPDGGPAYYPLEEAPDFFCALASLFRDEANDPEKARADLIAFASRFGRLGLEPDAIEGADGAVGERVSEWRYAVRQLRAANALHAAIAANDRRSLEQWIQWNRAQATARLRVPWPEAPSGLRVRGVGLLPVGGRLVSGYEPVRGTLAEVGEVLLVSLINRRLSGETSSSLDWDEADRVVWRTTVRTLLGVAWLQLGEAAASDRAARCCRNCGNWFALDPDDKRRHALYCSTKCRVAKHRQRKKVRRKATRPRRDARRGVTE